MAYTDKDIFVQFRASKLQRRNLKGMAKRRGTDVTGLIMRWYKVEMNKCKDEAASADVELKRYLKLDKIKL